MKKRNGQLVWPGLVFACVMAAGVAIAAEPAAPKNLLHVEIVNLRNNNGQVLCALYADGEGFPTESEKATRKQTATIKDERAVCEFAEIEPGTYAVSVVHDENSNGKLESNILGIPKEGVGSSNDAKGSFGPPKFDAAKFPIKGGRLDLTIHIAYL